jgi:LytR cell envelope-related transcriptional attenuator
VWQDPYIEVAPQAITQAIQDFKAPDIAAATTVSNRDVGGTRLGKRSKPKTRPLYVIPAKKLKLWTLNGSAIDGQANRAAVDLRNAGYPRATVGDLPGNADLGVSGNAWNQGFYVTKIFYANARAKGAAKKLQGELSDADPMPFPPQLKKVKGRADIVIVTGHTYNGVHLPTVSPAVPKKTKAEVALAPTSMMATWQNMVHQLHYPALVPTVVPKGTVFSEPVETYPTPRVYKLNGQWAAHLTAYAGYRYDPAHVWGIQWARWPTAPILQSPSDQRLVKGKSGKHLWKLYYNGGQIHRIAVFYGKNDRYVTWVDNSLGDGFSNSTMIAIAKGLKPVSP